MRLIRLYCDPKAMALDAGFEGELDSRNAHYLKNVLRVRAGQKLELFDGLGKEYSANVSVVERRKVEIQVGDLISRDVSSESPLDICLAIGISKGERMDWVMQKSTELGVNRICPLKTQRCEVKLDEQRLNKKLEHWKSVVISASEQSYRSKIPDIAISHTFTDFVNSTSSDLSLVFDPMGKPLDKIATDLAKPKSITVAIGPEGGFTDAELNVACDSGYELCVFGPRILRTETAPVACLAVLQHLWGDC